MNLKIENTDNHTYFVRFVYLLQDELGFNMTYSEVEKKCIEEGYMLHFKNKKIKKWHLGIWAVGHWGIKSCYEDLNGETQIYPSGYDVERQKPLTICVFLVHDWTFDKFRPSYADHSFYINYEDDMYDSIMDIAKELNEYLPHNVKSYNHYAKEDGPNKYKVYLEDYWWCEVRPFIVKWWRRFCGSVNAKIITTVAKLDKRVAHVEHRFHKDKWNNEHSIAIVFKYGKTEWHDWKVWSDYMKFSRYNVDCDFTYLDEDGTMPNNIWRGVFWTGEPDKEN